VRDKAKTSLSRPTPPFFRALADYAANGSHAWHCPGHSGGQAFLKSPFGEMFQRFFGENLLRADACNAVKELGHLLDHSGAVADAEQMVARILHCDHAYFVTHGTSTSNKIVWQSMLAPGDIVLVDRNCHKSVLHAIILTGATPVFLPPTRNHYGIIGPVPQREFEWKSIKRRIDAHPLIGKDNNKAPRLLTITQSTYDGILYNADAIKKLLDGKINVLHFDEAWLPHATFDDFYAQYHAIGKNCPRCQHSLVFSTQSTHKVLAGLSQASQVLVHNAIEQQLDLHKFNEAYLMHSSTSPQYAIIASCEMAIAMMEGSDGKTLVGEAIHEALEFRRAMLQTSQQYKASEGWWFTIWGPEDGGSSEREASILKDDDTWHGFGKTGNGFNLLDPIKVTILTPGLDINGNLTTGPGQGIPACIVASYLAEQGIIVEKYGLYSLLVIFSIGVSRDSWRTLLTALHRFKRDYDCNLSLVKALPKLLTEQAKYKTMGLRDLCRQIHRIFLENDIARLTTSLHVDQSAVAMTPAQAFACMMQHKTERVVIDDLHGRIASGLLTPYPPGIPLLMPGEIFNRNAVKFLQFIRHYNHRFPGFENDMQGLLKDEKGEYYVDCVVTQR